LQGSEEQELPDTGFAVQYGVQEEGKDPKNEVQLMDKKKNQTNLKDAIVDLAKGLETVFKKYSKSTRNKAWERITSKKGEAEVKKILLDPTRQVNTFQKLATESFTEWMKRRES